MLKGIHRVAGPDITDYRDCNVYLLDMGREAVLVDAGFGAAFDRMLANIENAGVSPSLISTAVLTHCHIDHIGAAFRLRQELGSRLVMHEIDAGIVERGDNRLTAAFCFEVVFQPLAIDVKLSGERGEIPFDGQDISFLHTPGHTSGSISLYADSGGKRILFGQDLGAPLLKGFDCDPAAWRRSMESLLALKADILCDGHSGIYQPADAVSAYIRHFMKLYREEGTEE
ncbi:MAG: MBL fold metallo-hydrolase [Syntrophorhabdales bacterium]|jgi:glyoxylase-like metal-dependent hydrolase (beta-lactamase superfamily II)